MTGTPPSVRRRAGRSLVLYLAAVFVLGAATSVAVVRLTPRAPESWAAAILRKGPETVTKRCLQVWAVLLLPWLFHGLNWRGWRDLGLTPEMPGAESGRAPLRLAQGLALGLVTMGGVTLLNVTLGARAARAGSGPELDGWALAGFALSALAVGLFEEILARGILFRVPARLWGAVRAALVGGVLFGMAHFLEPAPEAFESASFLGAAGRVLLSTFGGIARTPGVWMRWLNLALLGVVLCAFVARTGTLWFAIGAHAGWVWCIRVAQRLTTSQWETAGWWGYRADATDSPGTAVMLLALLAWSLWGRLPGEARS